MAKPEIRDLKKSFVAGIFGMIAIGFVLYLTFKAQTGMPFAPTTQVKAAFENVDALQVNDDVSQNSTRIGRVDKIEFADGVAIVTLSLDGGDREIHKDATASITDVSALGTKKVELDPGTPEAGPLGDGVIAKSENTSSSDIYEVLNVLDEDTRAAAQSMLGSVGGGLVNRGGDLNDFLKTSPDLLADLGTTSDALSSSEADLPALLRSADELSNRFEGREQQIETLIGQTEETFDAISVDDGASLEATLNRLPETLDNARVGLDSLQAPLADTEAAMRELQPGAEALAASEEDLRGVLREGVPVVDKVPGVAGKAEPAVEELTATFADARPLAPRVTKALNSAVTPLQVLAPYGPETGQLFVRGASFVSEGAAPGMRYARLNANPGLASLTTGVLESCNTAQNNYPEPGEASFDRLDELSLPPGVPCLPSDTGAPLGMPLGAPLGGGTR